jgi:hypothetical protein
MGALVRKVLRTGELRVGAVVYYLHVIVGYTLQDIIDGTKSMQAWQVEELALRGLEHRTRDPEAWRKFVSKQ